MKTKLLIMGCLFTLLAVVSAYGQQWASIETNVPFQFTVGSEMFPAGTYTFIPEVITGAPDRSPVSFKILGPGNVTGTATVKGRMVAQNHASRNDAHLVFDNNGDQHMLAEIWIPGQDGFVVNVRQTVGAQHQQSLRPGYSKTESTNPPNQVEPGSAAEIETLWED